MHTDLSAMDEDKGIMSRKGKESRHLDGQTVHSWGHASFPELDTKWAGDTTLKVGEEAWEALRYIWERESEDLNSNQTGHLAG